MSQFNPLNVSATSTNTPSGISNKDAWQSLMMDNNGQPNQYLTLGVGATRATISYNGTGQSSSQAMDILTRSSVDLPGSVPHGIMGGLRPQNHSNANPDLTNAIDTSGLQTSNGDIVNGGLTGGIVNTGNLIDSFITGTSYVDVPLTSSNGQNTLVTVKQQTKGFSISGLLADTLGPNSKGGSSGINTTIGSSIGDGSSAVLGGLGNGIAATGNAVNTASKTVSGFVAPVVDSMLTMKKIGAQFDDIVKNSFLGRVLKLKGSEIMCMLFCIIISMLPCKTRQELYDAVMSIKNSTAMANAALGQINSLSQQSSSSIPLLNNTTLNQGIAKLFSKSGTENPTANIKSFDKILSQGIKASITNQNSNTSLIKLPPSVQETISIMTAVISVLAKGKISIPSRIDGDLWDISKAIMMVIQLVVMQAADEFMSKYVNKLRLMLAKMVPSICVGNVASTILNKFMTAINDLKKWLLKELKKLFGVSSAFHIQYTTYQWNNKSLLDLLALLKGLSLVLANFANLLLTCGIQPCPTSVDPKLQSMINNGYEIPVTNEPVVYTRSPYTPPAQTPALQQIAQQFASSAGITPDKVFASNTDISIVYNNPFPDAPIGIQSLINNPETFNALGSSYTVHNTTGGSGVTIVYTFQKLCS